MHLLESLHSSAIVAGVLGWIMQPSDPHTASVHWSTDVGHVTAVCEHAFALHVSSVHGLLSSQSTAILLAGFGTVAHPVPSKHTASEQISNVVQDAPMSVASHWLVVALHANVVHKVFSLQGSFGAK